MRFHVRGLILPRSEGETDVLAARYEGICVSRIRGNIELGDLFAVETDSVETVAD